MSDSGGGRSVTWRRLAAATLAPLAMTPFASLSPLKFLPPDSVSPLSILWAYVLNATPFYALAAPAGAVVWLLMTRLNAPPRFWLVVPLFTATLAALAWIYNGSASMFIGMLFVGGVISAAYCLIAWLLGAGERAGRASPAAPSAPDAASPP